MTDLIRDLTDDEARAALVCKWGEVEPDVLPAWVAEMDYAIAEPIRAALHEAVDTGLTGYPAFGAGGPLGEAYAAFAGRQFGHDVDPARVLPTVDVTAGVRLALDVAARPGGLVMPIPGYTPQLDMAAIAGRERLDLVVVRPARHRVPAALRHAGECADGPQRLVVGPRRGRLRGGLHPRRRVTRRAAHAALVPARSPR